MNRLSIEKTEIFIGRSFIIELKYKFCVGVVLATESKKQVVNKEVTYQMLYVGYFA
jgi:hypothetical protein